MDAVLERALALRGVTGVLVLTRDSWLTIASRGTLSANDAPAIERLLSWTEEDSTGSIPWLGGEEARCLHYHRASTHTLILMRHRHHRLSSPASSLTPRPNVHGNGIGFGFGFGLSPPSPSPSSPSSGPGRSPGAPPPRAPRMRFGLSATSSLSEDAFGLRAGSASLFAPSCSLESAQDVHRPSSWY